MTTPLFLLLEDKTLDTEAIQATLIDGGIECELLRVDTRADFETALETVRFDLILAAYAVPGFDGIAALETARNLRPSIPFIFVSAKIGEELAIEALKRGATDYVLKQQLERLVPVVQRALWEAQERRGKRAEAALRESEARLQLALGASGMGTFLWHIQDERGEPDAQMLALFGLPADSPLTLAEALTTLIHPDDRTDYAEAVARATNPTGTGAFSAEVRVLHPNGVERWLAITGQTVFENESHCATRMYGMAADITDRKRTELNREFLIAVSQDLAEAASIDEIVQTVGASLNRYLHVSLCAFVEINERADEVVIDYDWHQSDRPSLIGAYSLPEFVSDEFLQAAKAGQPIVIQNYALDPRVTDPSRYSTLR